MTTNDKTEQPIPGEHKVLPEELVQWILSETDKIYWENGKSIFRNAVQKTYDKLHSLPPSPVGEAGDEITIQDYKDSLDDKNGLTKEIDIIINGKNAAKQASLCDMIGQIKELVSIRDHRPAKTERAGEISPVLPWLKDLIEMGEDGYKLHRSNAVHQEFLEEDRETLSAARKYLAGATRPTPAPEVKEETAKQKTIDFAEQVAYFYEIVGGGKGQDLIWQHVDENKKYTTAELYDQIAKDHAAQPTEQPARVPDPKGEIPEETRKWIKGYSSRFKNETYEGCVAGCIAMWRYCMESPFKDIILQRDTIATLTQHLDEHRKALEDISSGKVLPQLIAQQAIKKYPLPDTKQE